MRHKVIVIGASAGGLPALQQLVARLPKDLNAAVFVVLHIPPWYDSHLPSILGRSGLLPALAPANNEAIRPGRIYCAPADWHLILDGNVQLWRGPKENFHRPAINPLFRSAAIAFGPNVIGVILSGALDDGVAGLWMVKKHGGIAVAQDPADAASPDMPRNAIEHVKVDYVASAPEIGDLLTELCNPRGNGFQQEEAVGRWKPRT